MSLLTLMESVARIIAQYPEDGDWQKANATQRAHYEALAGRAIEAAVRYERGRVLAGLDEMISAAEKRRAGHHAVPWLQSAKANVEGGLDPRDDDD
jgi:hypothetical protein